MSEMPDQSAMYDRVVIGAGIIGSCAAYQLIQAGHRRVLLLDQFPLPHSRGSSHGQSRVIRTAYPAPVDQAMARRSHTLWTELGRRAGETLLVDIPLLLVAEPAVRAKFDTYLSCMEDQHVYSGEELSRQLPAAEFPAGSVAALDGTGGLLRADRCLLAVRRLLAADGGEVRDGAPVSGVHPVPGSGGRLLHVSGPEVTCRGLVVCAGAWAGPLLAPLGLPRLPSVLQPQKIAVTYWRTRPGVQLPLAGIHLIRGERADSYYYWLPAREYPGLVKLCNHWGPPCDPDRRDHVSVEEGLQQTKDYVARTFPGLEPEPAIVETCMYTVTPDQRCILDTLPQYPNIAIAAGMSGHGFKMAPAFGEALQRLVDGQDSDLDLSAFSLKRFKQLSTQQ